MKAFVIWREKSEHRLDVESFIRDFENRTSVKVAKFEIDTIDGAEKARVYGVTSYPAIIVARDDGAVVQMWSGPQLPMFDEVAAAALS